MRPVRFDGAKVLNAPKDWDESRDGVCVGLPVQISANPEGFKTFTSIWKPSLEQRRRIAEGENIALSCFAAQVPVMLSTTPVDGEIVLFPGDEAPSQ